MNVLYIGMDPSPTKKNGKVMGDLRERLVEYGKHLKNAYVITYSPKSTDFETTHFSNIEVIPTKSFNRLLFIFDGIRIGSRLIKEKKIDIISVQDPMLSGIIGYTLKKKFGIPLITQIHGDYLDSTQWLHKSKTRHILNIIVKFIIKRADGVRVVSDRLREKVENLGIPKKRIFRIPVFIDTKKIVIPGFDLKKAQFSEYEGIVLFVGRLAEEKNLGCLIRASRIVLKKFPKTLFLIVGDGPERMRLEELSRDLMIKENIIFDGLIEHKKLPNYYQMCDLFVLPSKHEGRGLVLIEAMAASKPVVTTDVGVAGELIINGETGFVVPVNDCDELAKKIITLLGNPELRKRMGSQGRAEVMETQDIKKNAHKLREMYEEVLELKDDGLADM
jgi:glycosyltransferase involved in cell wall biosynthesis